MSDRKVNIIYTRPLQAFGPLAPGLMRMINSVHSRILLTDVSELVSAEAEGDTAATEKLDAILADTEIMYGFPLIQGFLTRAPKMKWIQSQLVGVEMFLTADFIKSPIVLTNARGIHNQVAELAMMFALMLAKYLPATSGRQAQKRWQKFTPGVLDSKILGIVGLGNIGKKIAKLAKAFHMKVIATDILQMKKPSYVDVLFPAGKLKEVLAQSDFLVVAVPLTRETSRLIAEKELRSMKPAAFLINIARGGIIDEPLLVRALQEKWIAGAGLDVFASEPLHDSSPLWNLPNVIVTPHCAGLREDYDKLVTGLFCKNLRRYLAGKELLNIVDKDKGY